MSGNRDPNAAANGGGIPRPRSSLSQTPEEIARAAAAVRPPPSIVVSAKQPSKLKRKIGGFWGRGKGTGSLRKGTFNPEELTSQKRQWAKLQKQGLEARHRGEPTHLFEHFVVVGLPPTANVAATEAAFAAKKAAERAVERAEKLGDEDGYTMYKGAAGTSLQPEVLFKYPPGKRLALKDLPGFCFPNGVQARVMERTPSMSELNEVIYGQSYQKKDDQSFVFLLKVADNVTLYGVCVLVHEMVQRPPGVLAMSMAFSPAPPTPLSKYLVSAPRCYCILTQYPFFDLHFEVLYNVLAQERLDRITACVSEMVVDVSSPMVKVSSRQRMASPPRGPNSEDDPNEWMDSAIPVDEVLGNTLTSQGFRIEDRPRSPSRSLPASPVRSPKGDGPSAGGGFKAPLSADKEQGKTEGGRSTAGGVSEGTVVGESKGGETRESGEREYRTSRLGDERLSRAEEHGNGAAMEANRSEESTSVAARGEDEGLQTMPSLVGMVSVDLSDGIPVEDTGIPVGPGADGIEVLRQGLQEGAEAAAPSIPPTVPEERPLEVNGKDGESGELDGRVSLANENADDQEARGAANDEDGVGGSEEASTSGRGGATEPGQYKTKRPPAIAVSVPAPIPHPELGTEPDTIDKNGSAEAAEIGGHVSKGLSEAPNGKSGEELDGAHIPDARIESAPSFGSEAFALHPEATPSTTASARPSAHHTRMNSVDSAYSVDGASTNVSIDGSTEADEESSPFNEDSDFGVAAALAWAEANGNDSLRIVCDYHKLEVPPRGGSVVFQLLDHLQPLAYERPAVIPASLTGGRHIDLALCKSKVELIEAQAALASGEEALAVSVWSVATLCRALSLENVMSMLVSALLEKQIVVICPNLGVLSAIVLSIVPLLRPFMWQCLLLPVLPADLLVFLEAPVPFLIGLQHKTAEVRSKIAPLIRVNVYKNKVKMTSTVPPIPKAKQLAAALEPFHAKLAATAGESRRRPAFKTTEAQAKAVEGFLAVLRGYLESLCSDLRAHTITDVGASGDRVSLLLKDSFIDSFSHKDRPFIKVFVETQMFSMYTDGVLSAQDR
ncbi:DENN domain containing protein [Klebsormidium nitens]|uniref:DENN domain containing protein n=1 Tax=Klebsormidium nitens TaxID=105231 RepID=A0A1Y1I644_KLENI|nr:DENN domain containing protein [Klebsormidium nitens]|eukprot:GAQ83578.1 DENN domain containing protein [Klebsormidium nitens]